MCGFVAPDTGSVRIDPSLMGPGNVFPQEFGIIIDSPAYLGNRTGFDNLASLAAIRKKIGAAEIRDAMPAVDLDPDLEQKVKHYSMGMKKKLALVQAFMKGQQVLLLDEPFNALDDSSVERVHALLQLLHEDGRTIVFTSHNPTDVDALATRRSKIDRQRLAEVG